MLLTTTIKQDGSNNACQQEKYDLTQLNMRTRLYHHSNLFVMSCAPRGIFFKFHSTLNNTAFPY